MNREGNLLLAPSVTLWLSAEFQHGVEAYGRTGFSKVNKTVWDEKWLS